MQLTGGVWGKNFDDSFLGVEHAACDSLFTGFDVFGTSFWGRQSPDLLLSDILIESANTRRAEPQSLLLVDGFGSFFGAAGVRPNKLCKFNKFGFTSGEEGGVLYPFLVLRGGDFPSFDSASLGAESLIFNDFDRFFVWTFSGISFTLSLPSSSSLLVRVFVDTSIVLCVEYSFREISEAIY